MFFLWTWFTEHQTTIMRPGSNWLIINDGISFRSSPVVVLDKLLFQMFCFVKTSSFFSHTKDNDPSPAATSDKAAKSSEFSNLTLNNWSYCMINVCVALFLHRNRAKLIWGLVMSSLFSFYARSWIPIFSSRDSNWAQICHVGLRLWFSGFHWLHKREPVKPNKDITAS